MREPTTVNDQSLSALALEYQGDYGSAFGNLDILDLVNDPAANGKCSIFGLCLGEKVGDLRVVKFGSVFDDRADALLVRKD